MNTVLKSLTLMSMGLLFSSFVFAGTSKKLEPIEKQNIEFDITDFQNYLENGSPHELEGVYISPDKRYQVAIVKNDTKHHDFIGIVISADNSFWEVGDVKFNFLLKDGALVGYYYQKSGKQCPVEFKIVSDTLQLGYLQKIM